MNQEFVVWLSQTMLAELPSESQSVTSTVNQAGTVYELYFHKAQEDCIYICSI